MKSTYETGYREALKDFREEIKLKRFKLKDNQLTVIPYRNIKRIMGRLIVEKFGKQESK